jgi:hypothetical protein
MKPAHNIDPAILTARVRRRFWEQVDKSPGLGPNGACWEWRGYSPRGYGRMTIQIKMYPVHRLSYVMTNGALAAALYVLHSCDNRACVNPDHLRAGTAKDNMADCIARGRRWTGNHRGNSNGRAKVNEESAREIRALYATGGHTQTELAELFSITQTAVSLIVRNKRWGYV